MPSSEVAPFAKTGGLADVVGALPVELSRRGHDVRIVMPLYASIDRDRWDLRLAVAMLGVPVGFEEQWCAVHEAKLPDSNVTVYFIEHHRYFGRPHLYQYDGHDYDDNAERFAFFSRAALQLCKAIQFAPEVVHSHDWQTALVPAYLKTFEADHPLFWGTASVHTIHNLGYQGVYPKDEIVHCQLGWQRYTGDGLEFYGQVNYLKAGILYADKVATVSPNYAREIQLPEFGFGLDGVLRARSADLVGILNGCDYREWDPGHDPYLPATFDVDRMDGKQQCAAALRRRFDLPDRKVPIVGMVTRLAFQKGIDVLAAAMDQLMVPELQFVVVGTGEIWTHFYYGDLPRRFPGKAGAYIGFDEELAHLVYAGSDFFLMPSRYEPCGLGQLCAKRYGTLPIVRATGGLEDTVENYDEATGGGDGFKFHDLTAVAIANTVGWAVSTYYDRPEHLRAMIDRGMRQRFSWQDAAERYEHLYQWAIERHRGY